MKNNDYVVYSYFINVSDTYFIYIEVNRSIRSDIQY